jgi:hypothetical protein
MKPLVLTSFLIPEFTKSGLADLAVDFFHRFIWGPLPSEDELKAYLGPRASDQHSGTHWSAFTFDLKQSEQRDHRDLGLAEFCQQYEAVEFDEWELGYLLDGLAFGPRPPIAGWDEELRTIRQDNLRDRHRASLRSRLSLTEFGWAVVAHEEDFSRHNPIDRW